MMTKLQPDDPGPFANGQGDFDNDGAEVRGDGERAFLAGMVLGAAGSGFLAAILALIVWSVT